MSVPIAIEIVEYATLEVVKRVEVTGRSDREIEKIDSGMNINLDHEHYFTRIRRKGEPGSVRRRPT